DPNFDSPYTVAWNFGIQQELSKKSVLEVRYVGSHIVGQFQTLNGNPNVSFLNNAAQCLQLDPGTFSNGIVVGSPDGSGNLGCTNLGFNNRPGTNGNGKIDPTLGNVRIRTNGASGIYNGLQV